MRKSFNPSIGLLRAALAYQSGKGNEQMTETAIRGKLHNDYALAVGSDFYASIPKAVWAAIAVSALTQGGDRLDEAAALVAREWAILHSNGIVPQAPNKLAGESV